MTNVNSRYTKCMPLMYLSVQEKERYVFVYVSSVYLDYWKKI